MMHGAELLSWARRTAMEWWDKRHDTAREKLEELLARAYLQGGIDALRDEITRKREAVKP